MPLIRKTVTFEYSEGKTKNYGNHRNRDGMSWRQGKSGRGWKRSEPKEIKKYPQQQHHPPQHPHHHHPQHQQHQQHVNSAHEGWKSGVGGSVSNVLSFYYSNERIFFPSVAPTQVPPLPPHQIVETPQVPHEGSAEMPTKEKPIEDVSDESMEVEMSEKTKNKNKKKTRRGGKVKKLKMKLLELEQWKQRQLESEERLKELEKEMEKRLEVMNQQFAEKLKEHATNDLVAQLQIANIGV